ncbi:MAG: indolepyruvate ferredoxin oxidoreductase subunit alpha [Victivallaceae bacterium]|nr:indolepyruvate ferredoxin oxidoreductase subunit alpha [Victivallaceae bacterium]
MKTLLSGNEAIARGAWEAGVSAAFGYPGTPSTEILENLVAHREEVYCEWSPNEKVALESAAGAAIGGVRSMVTMKHVGLNVAADPMMTLSYVGIVAGMVIVVADDPGQHSSQTEQDTRHYARLAKLPILEPGNAVECRSYMKFAFELSEMYRCPVILRSTTCVSHSRYLVEVAGREEKARIPFVKNPQQFVPIPVWGRVLRRKVEERMLQQAADASNDTERNQVYRPEQKQLGILSSGVTAFHALDLFPEASILKLGRAWPFPDDRIREFAASCERLLVLEEGDPFLEEHVRALGIACDGKNLVPRTGELTPRVLMEVKAKLDGKTPAVPSPVPEAADLPNRPPMLCAGCPHRGLFYGLGQFDVVVTGDIGCYSLGVFPPLDRTDLLICMGGGFTLAHGMKLSGETRPVVGIVGDSTFFHSGITGLLNLVYNQGNATLVVVDNRTTAMTGHQDHPGTGKTLMGNATVAASIEEIARACGMKRIRVVNPYDAAAMHRVLAEELFCGEPSLIISRAPCILKERSAVKPPFSIDPAKCKNCKGCLKLGCPAIETPDKAAKPSIDRTACTGCGLCEQVCRFGAIGR